MGRTKEVLRELGSAAVNDDVLVEAGKKVLRDGVREYLAGKGLTEAVGFVIELRNGETYTILSENSPRMDTPMEDVKSIEVKQSAKAGGLDAMLGELASVRVIF